MIYSYHKEGKMTDEEIAKILQSQDDEFKRLGQEHRELEDKLSDFNGRVYLSPAEENEKKGMQKLKLKKKDRMAEIIRKFRESISLN
jgi:uncharacterized protein YdcH (DUF465 family)